MLDKGWVRKHGYLLHPILLVLYNTTVMKMLQFVTTIRDSSYRLSWGLFRVGPVLRCYHTGPITTVTNWTIPSPVYWELIELADFLTEMSWINSKHVFSCIIILFWQSLCVLYLNRTVMGLYPKGETNERKKSVTNMTTKKRATKSDRTTKLLAVIPCIRCVRENTAGFHETTS